MVIFSFSHIQGVKIDNLAEKKLLSTVHNMSECERVHIISCDANLSSPGSSHGDRSQRVQERECVYTVYTINKYVFDGKPQELCRQVGSNSLIPPLTL